ncbi:hypothetical protein [Pseudomonas sp. NBRC 111121]|uniref:hypothetical protein n=1 Tax=Pseudomonas sp. NBRC 111121 TaxID=1661036 RepID=UPI0007616765|nr:hypothetical protein [Pseudomonas sp. NBRC 111121]
MLMPRQNIVLLLFCSDIRKLTIRDPEILLVQPHDLPDFPERGVELISFRYRREVVQLSLQLTLLLGTCVRIYPIGECTKDKLKRKLSSAQGLYRVLTLWHLDQNSTRH